VTLELWFLLALTLLAGAMSPGPSVALVVRTAITYGRAGALAVALAHGVGIALYAIAVVLGLAALIQSSSFLMTTLQMSGALFLFYLGCQMLFGGGGTIKKGIDNPSETSNQREGFELTLSKHALSGFLIVFFNPKVVIFFVAIFSQFLNANQSFETQLIAAAMAGGVDAAWYALVAVFVSNPRFADTLTRASAGLDCAFGLLFVTFGVFVFLSLL